MSDQATEQEEQTEEQVEAAFAEGFGSAPEQSAPETKTDADGAVQTTETETKAEGDTQATEKKADAPAESPRIAGMTEAEWNAAVAKGAAPVAEELRKEIRKSFGQFGELKRELQELKQRPQGGTAGRKITADLLKRVNEELPGLGDALAQDLSEILGTAEVAQAKAEAKGESFDQEKFITEKLKPALGDIEARLNQRAELRIVKSIHRDFDTVVKTPEFAGWLKTLPEERQKEVRESDDGLVAADAVTEFKTWNAKAKTAKEQKSKRLESAVTPKGVPGDAPIHEDEDALLAKGFNQAGRQYAR